MRLKLDQDLLGLSVMMERFAAVHVKDCFKEEDIVYFIVSPGELGKAIGKGGQTIKRVEQELGKKIRVFEFSENITDFIRNIIYPLQIEEIMVESNHILLKDSHKKTKGLLIGRSGKGLVILNRAVKRFFPDREVRVI